LNQVPFGFHGISFRLWGRDEEHSRFLNAILLCQVVTLNPFTPISFNQELENLSIYRNCSLIG